MSAYPTLLCWAVKYVVPQVKEYGARAFKFYNVRYDFGEPFPWRMDDPRVAYPLYEKARELGFNLIAVPIVREGQGTRIQPDSCT